MAYIDPDALPMAITLDPDEIQKEIWRPKFRFFLLKISVISVTTALILGGTFGATLDFFGVLIWLGSLVISAAFYAFVFDDFLEWRARKDDVWVLTNRRLIYYNPQDENSPASMPLDRIKKVRRWMFWAVRVRLIPRDQLMMLFLPERAIVRDAIAAAVALATNTMPQEATTL